jgi:DNA topoisomerase-2
MLGYLKKETQETPIDLDEPMDAEMPDAAPAPAPAPAPKRARAAPAKTVKKAKPDPVDSDSDEDVFAAVAKETEKKKPAETITTSRTARGAAKKATNYVVDKDSDSDGLDDDFDVSNMVQTIGGKSNDRPLFSTSARPSSATGGPAKTGRGALSKLSSADLEDPDETNYEGLMPRGSPLKPAPRNVHDTIMSSDDEDDFGFGASKKLPTKAAPKPKAAAVKPKSTASTSSAAAAAVAKKASQRSPAAKAYAARLDKAKAPAASKPAVKAAPKKPTVIESDEDEDELNNTEVLADDILSDEDDDEPIAKPKSKPAAARPVRKADILSDNDEDESIVKPKSKPAAARPGRKADILSDDEEDESIVKPKSKPAAARPGRRAAATKPAKYVVSDDDESDEPSEASFDDDSE